MANRPTIGDIKRPIKVLFVSHNSGMWGAERSLLLLLKNIDRRNFEPIVILPGPGPLKEKIDNLNIKTYEVWSPWWVKPHVSKARFGRHIIKEIIQEIIAVFKLCRIVSKEKVAVIYTNTIVKFSGAITAFITKKPHLWHIREIIPGNPNLRSVLTLKMLFKLISRTSRTIIANSNVTTAQFQGINSDEKIRVIYNASETNEVKDSNVFPDIGGVKLTDWLVVVIGQFIEIKAQDDAIRAVKIAKDKIPNIKLLLIGGGEGDFKSYLKDLVSELDISDSVIFTGYRNDVPQILPQCKILLAPYINEAFGRVVIEAMVAGVPVIGANAGGLKEIIQEGTTGYLVPPKKPEEIAKKIIYLFHHPDLAKQMGNNGKKVVEEKFSVQNYTRGVENIIREVVNIRCKRLGSLNVKRASSIS